MSVFWDTINIFQRCTEQQKSTKHLQMNLLAKNSSSEKGLELDIWNAHQLLKMKNLLGIISALLKFESHLVIVLEIVF